MPQPAPHPLDNPAHAALTGPDARFAERRGRVLRYGPEISPWYALPEDAGQQEWDDVARLAGPGGSVMFAAPPVRPPRDWEITLDLSGVQLVDDGVEAVHDSDAVRLGPEDVPEMLDLTGRTRPGPFLPRTVELGGYLGIRSGGALVAMAGERMHPPGWTEISGVCTDPDFRGKGLARRLILAVAAGIKERGETPLLHTGHDNPAIGLYESLGFRLRAHPTFLAARVPDDATA